MGEGAKQFSVGTFLKWKVIYGLQNNALLGPSAPCVFINSLGSDRFVKCPSPPVVLRVGTDRTGLFASVFISEDENQTSER